MSTVLVIDSGNSRIKWALASGGEIGAIAAVDRKADLAAMQEAARQADSAIGCDVAGQAQRLNIEQALDGRKIGWVASGAGRPAGMDSDYQNAQLGADRWCALLGLHGKYGWGMAVMAGTAMTIDFLDRDRVFRGGLILPGRRLMHAALAEASPALPLVADDAGLSAPCSTVAAIAAGSIYATAGAVSAFAARHRVDESRIVVCGGGAETLAALLPESVIDPQLVLRGIIAAAGSD